jgi:hypothetical protein
MPLTTLGAEGVGKLRLGVLSDVPFDLVPLNSEDQPGEPVSSLTETRLDSYPRGVVEAIVG